MAIEARFFMISYLRGLVIELADTSITIKVQGIGFSVGVVNPAVFTVGEEIELFIQLTWHQELGPQLFGFKTKDEKILFNIITSVSGMGPKIALATLREMSPGAFLRAIELNDIKALSSIPGIGTKKAETIIVQIKDKVGKLVKQGFTVEDSTAFEHIKNLNEVLTSLGYGQREITEAISYVKAQFQLSPQAPFNEWLKKAFSYLSKKA